MMFVLRAVSFKQKTQTEKFRNIVVIGASAGGIKAINKLLSQVPAAIDAAIIGVLHLSHESSARNIVNLFRRSTSLQCDVAEGSTKLRRGQFFLAPENFHILVKDGEAVINSGPREHRYRPSIDVLFRSAAVNYGSRTIGIILSGMLDDGTSGMYAIKQCGGICIVQEPSEAEFHQMPLNVVDRVKVDYKVPLDRIAEVLNNVLSSPLPPAVPIPEDLKTETEITEKMMTSIDKIKFIGEKTDFTCPDCGGSLYEIKDDPTLRYRCYTGHVFNAKSLYDIQSNNLEESVWVSIRMLEERRNLLDSMRKRSVNSLSQVQNKESVDEIRKHIDSLKLILKKLMEEKKEK